MYPPNIAMLGHQLREIGSQLTLMGNRDWFTKRGIELWDKSHYWMLQKDAYAEKNHWNILCNGTLFGKGGTLFSHGPIKLYDINHKYQRLNISQSDIIEKIGGHMLCVCWPYGNESWVHTAHELSCYDYDMTSGSNLKYLRDTLIRQVDLSSIKDKINSTYTFHILNGHVFLVHATDIVTHCEANEDELDAIAKRIYANRPMRQPCNDGWKTIYNVLDDKKDTRYIIRDRTTGERFDCNSYPKCTASWKRLVPYWRHNEHIAFMERFPETKERYIEFEEKLNKTITSIKEATKRWFFLNIPPKDLLNRLDESDEPRWMLRFILSLCHTAVDEWDRRLHHEFTRLEVSKLIKILDLKDQ